MLGRAAGRLSPQEENSRLASEIDRDLLEVVAQAGYNWIESRQDLGGVRRVSNECEGELELLLKCSFAAYFRLARSTGSSNRTAIQWTHLQIQKNFFRPLVQEVLPFLRMMYLPLKGRKRIQQEVEPEFLYKRRLPKKRIDLLLHALFKEVIPRLGRIEQKLTTSAALGRESRSACRNVFRRDRGGAWIVTYCGETRLFSHVNGLSYVYLLLQCPGTPIKASQLIRVSQSPLCSRPALLDGDLENESEAGVPILDEQACKAYTLELKRLQEEYRTAEAKHDLALMQNLQRDQEFISSQLNVNRGLYGRKRTFATQSERARVTVQKAIRHALHKIRHANTELAEHLQAAIKTGTWCVYDPEPRIEWQL